ncbi:hypothetical protein BaRGS_00032886 [Batillaria attramentaria]|uniref:Uncharacterized protein n=1 Tax=Batillaria attramentaria TaxID=370345 RepID=A0ABD0JLT2_9CAEN
MLSIPCQGKKSPKVRDKHDSGLTKVHFNVVMDQTFKSTTHAINLRNTNALLVFLHDPDWDRFNTDSRNQKPNEPDTLTLIRRMRI